MKQSAAPEKKQKNKKQKNKKKTKKKKVFHKLSRPCYCVDTHGGSKTMVSHESKGNLEMEELKKLQTK
jgi:hypothetical protein